MKQAVISELIDYFMAKGVGLAPGARGRDPVPVPCPGPARPQASPAPLAMIHQPLLTVDNRFINESIK